MVDHPRKSRFALTFKILASFLTIVVPVVWQTGDCECRASQPESAIKGGVVAKFADSRASATGPTKVTQVPEWWRRESVRRQQMGQMQRWLAAREIKTDAKQMWNPRSPQAAAFLHASLMSKQLAQSKAKASLGIPDKNVTPDFQSGQKSKSTDNKYNSEVLSK